MFFFFGTLMDPDVLVRVLGRSVGADELKPATLEDHRRVRAASAPCPVLVAWPGATVAGRLMRPRSPLDEARIAWFEEEEYTEQWWPVRRQDGQILSARVFFAGPGLGATRATWDLEDWARHEKAGFLRRCERWLEACPVPRPN